MKVCLISRDRQLYATCRKVLIKLDGYSWDLTVTGRNPEPTSDIYIWDYESESSLAGFEAVTSKGNIFLIERENLPALRSRLRRPPVWTVLKPLNATLLESLLAESISGQLEASSSDSEAAIVRKDRDALLQSLFECNLLLQRIDQSRSNMVIQSSRELRSPLMATLGYCRLLLDQQLGPLNGEQQKVIQRMQQSTQRLFRLSTSMLHAALGPEARIAVNPQQGDIEECVERAVAEILPLADARNIGIVREIATPPKEFSFDSDQVFQMVATLLDQAVRSTARGGEIVVRAHPVFWDRRARNLADATQATDRRRRQAVEPNAYRIEIHDPGMAMRYAAADRNSEMEAGSSQVGLSVAMCQQVVDAHCGRLIVEGDEDGYLAFELPLKPEEVATDLLQSHALVGAANANAREVL